MKNSLLQKHMKVGTIVTEAEVPFFSFQIIEVGNESVTIRQMYSKQDYQIPKENFLVRYRFFYQSKNIVESE